MSSQPPPWPAPDDDDAAAGPSSLPPPPPAEKKPRKKWSQEETQMLVDGCNRHGVGNWKTILGDPTLKFDNRSPVDLKDRFRTYFPDAYKKHYPNARTHLSSKVRSTLPDGSSLFEKTRSKRRRPFTEEEDRALKAGYEKHGTVWATIVKDPIFQEQNRRSTDLRDRFRNAFPELYQAAGYKPRNSTSKKKKVHDAGRAATDDQLALSTSGATGPVRGIRRRRAQTSQGILLRGGTKSVPQSAACTEYEDSSGPEDEDGEISSGVTTNMPKTPLSLMPLVSDSIKKCDLGLHPSPSSPLEHSFIDDDDMGMRLIPLDSITSDSLAEYPSSALENHPQPPNPISPLQHTPTHPHHTWPSPQDSDGNSVNDTHQTSQQYHDGPKIGQSAWGPQDWLSANPRLDHSFPSTSTGNSTPGTGTPSSYFSPSSPFTSYNLPPLNNTNSHPMSPPSNTTASTTNNATTSPSAAAASTTTTSRTTAPPPSSSSVTASAPQTTNPLIGNITNLTTLNLPMNYINYYNSHQHHGVIERYDLWPPSSSALASSSTFSAVNNSSLWSVESGPFSSESFAGDISSNSEVSYNEDDVHSAFSDEYSNADEAVYNSLGYVNNAGGSGRAITHHSDYAGDLIFGARGYGIGGGFGWFGSAYAPPNITGSQSASGNPGTPGLRLMGITTKGNEKAGEGDEHHDNAKNNDDVVVVGDGKGSINPMQLHAPSPHTQTTTAIDEIALAGINLNDSQDEDEEMQAVGVDGPRGENEGVGLEGAEVVEEDDAMDGITTGPTTRRRRRTIGGISGRGLTSTPPLSSSSSSSPAKRTTQRSFSGSGGVKSATASPQLQFRNANLGTLRLPSGQTFSHHAIQQPHLHNIQHAALSLTSNAHSTASPSSSTSSTSSASLATPPGGIRALSSSPPVAPSTASTNNTTVAGMMTPYGSRFSLDDLDLIEFAQAQHALVDINNLTPPATPVMHHAIRGSRKYSIFGGGGGGVGGNGAGSGLGLLTQGQNGGAGRSISVPPGENRNTELSGNLNGNANNGSGGNNSLGMSFGGGHTRSDESAGGGVTQRGRSLTANGNAVPSATSGVKRSLSSTVHHSHGQAQQHHGHSLSMSTVPPFPSHSEIWRSKTPVAKTSPAGNLGTTDTSNSAAASNVGGAAATIRTTNANANMSNTGSTSAASFFSGLFSPPLPSSSSSPSSGVSGNQQQLVNSDVYTNPDLPFLDLHYNLGHAQNQISLQQHQQQQLQQGFGAMLVDTPSTSSGGLMGGGGFGSGGDSGGGGGMTQAELEARQALDLAQPFYTHNHGHHPNQLQQPHAFGQGQGHHHSLSQGTGFGFPSTTAATTNNRNVSASNGNVANTGVGGGGGGLKTFMGNVFNTPLNLTRQFSQFSVSAATARQQTQQTLQSHQFQQQHHTHQHQLPHHHHHHQRGQSQQVVVNPKDLVLNAGSDSDGNGNGMLSSSLRLDGSKRKRASWDGGMV